MSVNCFFVFQHGIHCLPCAVLPNFIKTAFTPGMTGNAAVLFNQHNHCIAIAIQAQFVYFLRMSGLFALHPLFLAGTAVIVGKTGFYGFCRASAFIQATISTRCVCQSWAMAQTKPFSSNFTAFSSVSFIFDIRVFLPYFSDGLWVAITNALRFLLRAWPVLLRRYSLRQSGKYWRPIPHRPSLL